MSENITPDQWKRPADIRKNILAEKGLAPEWLEKSDTYGWLITLRILVPFFACFVAAPLLWMHVSPWTVLPLAMVLGIYGYKISFIMHDCSHDTLFATRSLNDHVGSFCGWLVGSEYFLFKRVHQNHHRHNGTTDDPQHDDYCGFKNASRAQIMWHLVNALLFWRVPAYLKTYLGNQAPEKKIVRIEGEGFSWAWAAKVIVTQILLLAVVTGFGDVLWLAFLYPVSAATFSLFFARLRTVAEHIEPPSGEFEDFVRTHHPSKMDAVCLYDANFNYHFEHHMFPHMPSRFLPAFFARHEKSTHNDLSLRRSMFRTLLNRIKDAA